MAKVTSHPLIYTRLGFILAQYLGCCILARIFHESLAATTDMVVLPGVLGSRPLRRTVQVRLGTNPAVPRDELPGGTPIFIVSRQHFMKYPG
jgi:hypothetical protein